MYPHCFDTLSPLQNQLQNGNSQKRYASVDQIVREVPYDHSCDYGYDELDHGFNQQYDDHTHYDQY
jgi:hypothetical protein